MYRNARRKCCCLNNGNMKCNNAILETKCSDVPNNPDSCINSCECGFDEEEDVFPQNPMYAQSYVPWQTMDRTFCPEIGLRMGTIFPELVSPYAPCQSIETIDYIRNTNKIKEGCNR